MAKTKEYTKYVKERKSAGTESAQNMLSPQAKGEKTRKPWTRRAPHENLNVVMTLRLTDAEFQELNELAQQKGSNASTLVRTEIKEMLRRHKAAGGKQ